MKRDRHLNFRTTGDYSKPHERIEAQIHESRLKLVPHTWRDSPVWGIFRAAMNGRAGGGSAKTGQSAKHSSAPSTARPHNRVVAARYAFMVAVSSHSCRITRINTNASMPSHDGRPLALS